MFDGTAEHYDRFMGRYSAGLSAAFADFAGVRGGERVIDVGSGPGALTGELVARGAHVTAVGTSPRCSPPRDWMRSTRPCCGRR